MNNTTRQASKGYIHYTCKSRNTRLRKRLWRELHGDSDIGVCSICERPLKREEATLDHILERVLGGSSKRDNLALAHMHCNQKKSAHLNKDRYLWKYWSFEHSPPYHMMHDSFAQNFAPDFDSPCLETTEQEKTNDFETGYGKQSMENPKLVYAGFADKS